MPRRRPFDRLTLREQLMLQLEHRLVGALAAEDADCEWAVKHCDGTVRVVRVIVDEWLDQPVLEMLDPRSGEVVRRYTVSVLCWPAKGG